MASSVTNKNPILCPHCGAKQLAVSQCKGALIECRECGATLLADVEEDGKMIIRLHPKPRDCTANQ